MNANYFFVKDGFKEFRTISTCTGRFYDITGGHIDENNGLISNAIPVSDSYVAELMAKSRPNRKASRIRLLQKEEVI